MLFDGMSQIIDGEASLQQQFDCCATVVDDLLKGRLGDSMSSQRNETLKICISRLQSLANAVDGLSLFSANDSAEEIPTSSLHFLLIPAYLATALQEISVEMDKKGTNLRASKTYYREFLQNLSLIGLINFRLPWLDESLSDDKRGQSAGNGRSMPVDPFEEAKARRQRTVSRLQQLEQLERTVEQLKNEQRRNDDEAAQREIILTLLRLWSIRSVKELEMIEEELKMVEQFEMRNSHPSTIAGSACISNSKSDKSVRLKPFILARSEAQKRVFGLGYPSVPTQTVDEWYDQMQKSGIWGAAPPPAFTIGGQRKTEEENEEEEEEEDEESKRQAQIRRDEWKDMNRRGCGNTYNKG